MKLKGAYNLLITGLRGLQCKTNLHKIMGSKCSDVIRFDLGPLLQSQTSTTQLKSAYKSLIIGPRGLQCETNLYKLMCWKSSDVVRFDLVPLFQGQTRTSKLKNMLITCLLLILEVWNVEPTYRKSQAGNLQMWSDLALGPPFKVKRWFTGFGELSFSSIQICIGFPMC